MATTLEIAAVLRREILNGEILPGDDLRQEGLAQRFQVSRMPIRDALGILARDRLITLRPNRGGRVISLTADDIAEIHHLRGLLEPDAMKRAFDALDQGGLDRIRRAMLTCEAEAGSPGFPDADWRFHQALYAPSGRVRQMRMIEELRALCRMHRAAYDRLRDHGAQWSGDHRAILAALEGGDLAAAQQRLAGHIAAAGARLLASMQRTQPQGATPPEE